MPIYLRAVGYKVYIWSNEDGEPVHFHVTKGNPGENDTKIWLLSDGAFKVAHNKGRIPASDLTKIFSVMQNYYFDFIDFWKKLHPVKFYE